MVHEYPLEGRPPMMTHIFENENGNRIVAAKGAPERILSVCALSIDEKKKVEGYLKELTKHGYRVLGVASAVFAENNFPKNQDDFLFQFIGFVSFYDPPKKNIGEVFKKFYEAGIHVKIVTGDNKQTTETIANQIGFKGAEFALDGDELLNMPEEDLAFI